MSDEVFLTNYDGDTIPKLLALRIARPTIVSEEKFKQMEYLEVRVNGKLYKTNTRPLKMVGVLQKRFMNYLVMLMLILRKD